MNRKTIRPRRAEGELELLSRIRARAARPGGHGSVRLGIGDDCALVAVRPGEEVAVTTDLSIDGRHFRLDWHPPQSVGHRTLARGLSDLASMGARPVAAFLSLGVPRALTVSRGGGKSWVDGFFDGLFRLADSTNTALAGGDLAESQVALADIVLLGAVPAQKALRRSRARAGDALYVTGTLGGAAAGILALSKLNGSRRSRRWTDAGLTPAEFVAHLYPQPRLSQGLALRQRVPGSAAIDLSDGLSTDLAHLCEESGVGAVIQASLLPIAQGASLEQALHGGEDYELLFAARPSVPVPKSLAGVPITRIGQITARQRRKPPIVIATGSVVEPLTIRGWQHFTDH